MVGAFVFLNDLFNSMMCFLNVPSFPAFLHEVQGRTKNGGTCAWWALPNVKVQIWDLMLKDILLKHMTSHPPPQPGPPLPKAACSALPIHKLSYTHTHALHHMLIRGYVGQRVDEK